MSGLEVAACVASIISTFGTGMDVLRSLKAKRRARKLKRSNPPLEGELHVQQSLQRGPLEIQAEYDRYFARLGERFAAGDTVAHTSLAHTLLVLNSGIMQILSASLAADIHATTRAGNALLTLSDSSKTDTLRTLGQLHHRLLEASIRLSRPPRGHDSCTCGAELRRRDDHHSPRESIGKCDGHESRRREKGVGARGSTGSSKSATTAKKVDYAWVRSRKRPSLSSASSRTSSRSNSMETNLSTATTRNSKGTTNSFTTTRISKDTTRPSTERRSSNTSQKDSKKVIVPPSPPREADPEILLQRSLLPQFPVFESHQNNLTPRRADKVTPSMYSFMSDSTKLGEIPQHKWLTSSSDQVATPRLAMLLPPLSSLPEEAKEKPGFGKKLFRNFFKPSSPPAVQA